MNISKKFLPWILPAFLASFSIAGAATVAFTIDPTQANVSISPYIYGANSPITYILANGTVTFVNHTYYRSGGNRLSAYNWETNWSNAGSDYYYENDTNMGSVTWGPGGAAISFVNQNKAVGAASLWTLQLAGYVSANGEPNFVQVPSSEFMNAPGLTDPNGNFYPVTFVKPGPYSNPPNLNDSVVYIDECVHDLVQDLGNAASGGIKFYDLDNEPGAWSSVHAEVHNYPVSFLEVATKGVTVATQTTAIDPGAQILGPVADGWTDMIGLGSAPDAGNYSSYNNGNWVTFLNYYLAAMQKASSSAGRRLLHYLDCHVYSEGTDAGGNRINDADVSQDAATTRMQLPREMWDPTFTENNWISCCVSNYGPLTLIPRLQGAVSQYYPGTNLAFSEYDYGGGGDISGGIAQADFLGILGKYPNMMASIWDVGAGDQYLGCAYNFYLNYDGAGTHFGDTSVYANSNNVPECTVYAAKDSANPDHLNVIVLNKDYSNNNMASVTLNNLGTAGISSIRAFRFDSALSVITASTAPSHTTNTFTDTLPFRSATLYELTLSQGFATSTPTATGTPTATSTATATPTASPTGTLPTYTFTATKTFTPSVTATPTVTFSPTAAIVCTQLFNSCDSLTANGTWNGTNATRSISTVNKTQGTGDLQVNVTTASGFNKQIFNLTGFTPNVWSNVVQVIADIYVSSSLISAGSSYCQFTLLADSASLGQQPITPDYPNVNAGANSVTFNISFAGAGFPSTTPLTQLYFVYNTDSTGTGSFYVDNIRLVTDCSPTATSTPAGPTNTATPTASPSITRTSTATATITPSSTSTGTPTVTPTATFSLTSTSTPTPPNTPTSTPTWTSTSSPTMTGTPTPSRTATPTATFTSTATATSTPTVTDSFTPTSTPTDSFTPTLSPTLTETPTGTLPTFTNTPTSTATSTPTLTPTDSMTATPSLTASATPTPTFTATSTATATPTSTSTPSSTPSASATPTSTSTRTSTLTATFTATVTATFTLTSTVPPSATATSTGTSTASSTATLTRSATPTRTGTPTPTQSSTATRTLTPTSTSAPAPPPILLFPNPAPGSGPVTLQFTLSQPAGKLFIKLFTPAFRKVQETVLTYVSAGLVKVPLALEDAHGMPLANGIYYVVVETGQVRMIGKLLVLR